MSGREQLPGVLRATKRPVTVEVVRFDGSNFDAVAVFTGRGSFGLVYPEDREDDPSIVAEVWDRLHGTWVGVHAGDWIIKGVQGEFYPCVHDVFEATYEVEEANRA